MLYVLRDISVAKVLFSRSSVILVSIIRLLGCKLVLPVRLDISARLQRLRPQIALKCVQPGTFALKGLLPISRVVIQLVMFVLLVTSVNKEPQLSLVVKMAKFNHLQGRVHAHLVLQGSDARLVLNLHVQLTNTARQGRAMEPTVRMDAIMLRERDSHQAKNALSVQVGNSAWEDSKFETVSEGTTVTEEQTVRLLLSRMLKLVPQDTTVQMEQSRRLVLLLSTLFTQVACRHLTVLIVLLDLHVLTKLS